MWKSWEGVYAAYDPATARLYFRDGSFWVMGAVSGGIEKDAGTRYPTEMRDAFGNTILLRYDMGDGAAYADSSGRISEVEDARAVASGSRYVTYSFQYNNGSTRTLASISNLIGTAESYTFNVAEGQNLYSPFAPNSPSGTTALLLSITNGAGQTQSFSYSAAGELTRVDFPGGGYMRWDYRDFTFSGGRIYREVQTRYLATRTNAPEWPYGIGRDPSDAGRTGHYWADCYDYGAASQKAWYFSTDPANYLGMPVALEERVYPNVAVLSRRDFAWATSASGNPFLTRVTTRLNPGTADEATSAQDQTVDANGNVTTQRIYDYGRLTTPSRTWTAAYVTNPAYTSKQKFSLLASATVTDGAQTITAVQNTYDGTAAQAGGWTRNFVPAAAPVGFLTRRRARCGTS
jgi:YD repeat-containing protein